MTCNARQKVHVKLVRDRQHERAEPGRPDLQRQLGRVKELEHQRLMSGDIEASRLQGHRRRQASPINLVRFRGPGAVLLEHGFPIAKSPLVPI